MPILKRITEVVEGEEMTMEEQVYVVSVNSGGHEFWLRGNTFAFSIDRADGFDSLEEAAAAIQKASRFMKPAARKALVVRPYGGDIVRD